MIQRLTLYSGSLFCEIKYRDKTTILFFQSVVKTNIDPFTILRSPRIPVNEKGQQKRQFPTFFCIYRSIKTLPKTDRMIILTFSAPAFIQRLQISKLHTRAFAAHFSIKSGLSLPQLVDISKFGLNSKIKKFSYSFICGKGYSPPRGRIAFFYSLKWAEPAFTPPLKFVTCQSPAHAGDFTQFPIR